MCLIYYSITAENAMLYRREYNCFIFGSLSLLSGVLIITYNFYKCYNFLDLHYTEGYVPICM